MYKFMLCPLQAGYAVQPADNVEEYALTPGLSIQKQVFEGAVFLVSASVLLETKKHRKYWWAFWREWQRNPLPFLWDIQTDSAELEEHVCQFVVGSITESQRNGIVVAMSFQVRAVPIQRDPELDKAILATWQAGQGKSASKIEKIPNKWFPEATGGNV